LTATGCTNQNNSEAVDFGQVLIVEDDPAFRVRLQRLVAGVGGEGSDVVLTGDLATARQVLDARSFKLALVDVGLPDGSGIGLIGWMHEHHADTQTLVISSWGDERTVLAALRAGAIGYLLKERDNDELSAALHSIRRGGSPIDPAVARHILAQLDVVPASASALALTGRETEVLQLVARGYSNREIAELIGLSRFTIGDYIKQIYRKLAVSSRTEAVHEAQNRGLL
jgi:DNA-binding NarL/FixJ family response regulator